MGPCHVVLVKHPRPTLKVMGAPRVLNIVFYKPSKTVVRRSACSRMWFALLPVAGLGEALRLIRRKGQGPGRPDGPKGEAASKRDRT